MTQKRILGAITAAAGAALAAGLLPHPWDGIVVVIIAGLGTLYETPKPPEAKP